MPASSSARLRGAPKPFLHKASGQSAVKVRGRFYYLGKHGSKAAQEEYRRIINEIWNKPAAEPPVGLTLAQLDRLKILDLLTGFWAHADRYYVKDGKPSTTIAAITPPLRRLREQCGEQLAAEFGPLKLKALRQTWIDDGLALKTVNSYTAAVKLVFNWATENELVPASVGHGLGKVRHLAKGRDLARETEPVTAVADALVDATLPHLPQTVRDMVSFQRLTGCRPGEVCNLRSADVRRYVEPAGKPNRKTATLPLFEDLPAPRVRADVWEYHPPGHKMAHKGRPRVVMIGPRAQAIVDEYLARAGAGKCFGYTVAAYRRAIARACVRAFMPGHLRKIDRRLPADEQAALRKEASAWRAAHVWHPNQLRHTAATRINAHYGDDDAARVVLGHDSKQTTQIYVERDLAKAKAIAREVG